MRVEIDEARFHLSISSRRNKPKGGPAQSSHPAFTAPVAINRLGLARGGNYNVLRDGERRLAV